MDRILKTPPIIKPVEFNGERPLWSVMVPAYNCLRFLRQTLESVLVQDPGPAKMQIEVVDDCSSDGDVAALVQEVGKGRIGFFRQQENMGHHRNFATCLNRSKGQLVHLLHGDDLVKPGFYTEVEGLFETYPHIGAAFTKNGYIGEGGKVFIPQDSVMSRAGVLDNFLMNIAQGQMLQVVAMVVKRSVYERLGGFFAVDYCEDWEMWIRIAAHFPVAYSPQCLALYRTGHENTGSITSHSLLTGQNFANIKKVIEMTQCYLPLEKRRHIKSMAKKTYSLHTARSSYRRIYSYSPKVALIQATAALKLHQNIKTIYWVMKLYLLHFKKSIGKKIRELRLGGERAAVPEQ